MQGWCSVVVYRKTKLRVSRNGVYTELLRNVISRGSVVGSRESGAVLFLLCRKRQKRRGKRRRLDAIKFLPACCPPGLMHSNNWFFNATEHVMVPYSTTSTFYRPLHLWNLDPFAPRHNFIYFFFNITWVREVLGVGFSRWARVFNIKCPSSIYLSSRRAD